MPKAHDTLRSIVTDDLFSDAQEVVQLVRQTTTYPFLLDAKIGDANSEPIVENAIASTYETPLSTISQKVARIMNALAKSDQEHGNPLAQIAQRANAVMAQAAIVNRHNRRPPLYAESTIGIFVDLGFSSAPPDTCPRLPFSRPAKALIRSSRTLRPTWRGPMHHKALTRSWSL